jgi:DNA-binding HxlR family transcriptional regulator
MEPAEPLAIVNLEPAELLRMIFQGKWRLRILTRLCEGPVRLSELRRIIPEASKKMLIDSIHSLEQLQWIDRRDLSSAVRHVEYSLSPEWSVLLRQALSAIRNDDIAS